MEDIYEEIVKILSNGNKAALCTIISKVGSAPRSEGAKLLVKDDGTSLGSISGGCIEAEAWQEAKNALKDGNARVLQYRLTEKDAGESGLICGGIMDVFIEPILPSEGTEALFREIVQVKDKDQRAALATLVYRGQPMPMEERNRFLIKEGGGRFGSFGKGPLAVETLKVAQEVMKTRSLRLLSFEMSEDEAKENELAKAGKIDVLIEPIFAKPSLYIFGAGHISVPVAKLGKMCDFRVIVTDDRESFANRLRFPEADEIIVDEFENALRNMKWSRNSYIVIVTRGHLHDELVLEYAIKTDARYIGMIGSKTKIRRLYSNLKAKGVREEELKKVHAPIGLDIKAETPEEIAVSIISEIIMVRRSDAFEGNIKYRESEMLTSYQEVN